MERMLTIYVVIPVYKAEKYIAQTLDSVLGQPYENIRIVCVDDGSPDDSISILRDYERRYENIHVIRQENGGVSRARNTGIEYVLSVCSDHDYLTFLDADDLWAKDIAGVFPDVLQDRVDCVGFMYTRCSDDLCAMMPPSRTEEKIIPGGKDSLWCHGDHHFGAVLYSTALLGTHGIRFVDGLGYAEDAIFKFVCFYLARQIKLVDKVLYCYRINAMSAMHRRKYGTEFMGPVIDGYLKTADFLEERTGETARFCHVLAGVYAIEMCAEHFQKFRTSRKLQDFLNDNPRFAAVIDAQDRKDLSAEHQQMYDLYIHSPAKFRLRNYLMGAKRYVMDAAKRVKPIANRAEARRFPLPNAYL